MGIRPKKRLGQNFLIDEKIIGAIVRLADIAEGDEVLEIGPGMGFLTRALLAEARRVWAVEVDSLLVEWMRNSSLGSNSSLQLIHGDVLKIRFVDFLPEHKIKLVGNLPYHISTPVLFHILEQRQHFSHLVLMVQREVAERLSARPGTKSYGTLSIWCQVYGEIVGQLRVSPGAFFPQPKVHSTVLKIQLRPVPLVPESDVSSLRDVVRASFGQRRKTLSNALANLLKRERGEVDALLKLEGIDPRRRGETLDVEEMIRLARTLNANPSAEHKNYP
ncbi:MAG: ribosomal RNA small subunit methyltransferase A [Deltaproteobacteria bacterium]|nr:ribosomal RNA small subunit methyltransferase A [Deltaproteobacteria bacterium]